VVALDGERRPAARVQVPVAPLHGPLQVLGVQIPPAEDDEVLEPAGDEELSLVEEPEVARAQEGPLTGIREAGSEGLPGLLGLVPVALGDTWACDPDFPNFPG